MDWGDDSKIEEAIPAADNNKDNDEQDPRNKAKQLRKKKQ